MIWHTALILHFLAFMTLVCPEKPLKLFVELEDTCKRHFVLRAQVIIKEHSSVVVSSGANVNC